MLGILTKELIEECCPPKNRCAVSDLLSENCSQNIPGIGKSPEWNVLIDRIQLSAIRNSEWNIEKIQINASLANIDFRDLLMQAGFGYSLNAHDLWQKQAIKLKNIC